MSAATNSVKITRSPSKTFIRLIPPGDSTADSIASITTAGQAGYRLLILAPQGRSANLEVWQRILPVPTVEVRFAINCFRGRAPAGPDARAEARSEVRPGADRKRSRIGSRASSSAHSSRGRARHAGSPGGRRSPSRGAGRAATQNLQPGERLHGASTMCPIRRWCNIIIGRARRAHYGLRRNLPGLNSPEPSPATACPAAGCFARGLGGRASAAPGTTWGARRARAGPRAREDPRSSAPHVDERVTYPGHDPLGEDGGRVHG